MRRQLTILTFLLVSGTAWSQRYFEVGVTASRERISFVDLSRVAALPARTQDLNIGTRVIHHLNKRLAFLGCASYNMHRYFGEYHQTTNDLPANVAMMQVQSAEVALGVRWKCMSSAKLHPYVDFRVSQSFMTAVDFPDTYVINVQPAFVLPQLKPRFYNLALAAIPGIRYRAHDYLTFDLEPIFKWFIIGNTDHHDQVGLGWCVSLNYRIGK